ncbi:uncharacterized protein LOC125654473 isoform X3 [Ostrea edulis]|uniref:uncharacterized protein LOC125654473 isoform X3 n=1 Tax=Ostrea edulis TaxID=37623 RepID=UPI002094329B|nr:uncharacterized protein LOC125654473 isoform X3 [Ostrea edulis]
MTDCERTKDLYTIRDVTHDHIVTVHGRGQVHLIGLGVDGNIRTVSTEETNAVGVCVALIQLTITETGGMVLGPVNLDLCCTINSEDLTGEINLISGVPIEVADRTLRIYQGGIPSRKLPPTPGVKVKSSPPPKPRRDRETVQEAPQDKEKSHVPFIDLELLTSIKSTDKLADLAASFLTKQINQYTDTKLSSAITDQIFSFLQEVVGYQKAIIVAYINEISQSLEEMPESERDRPLHKPSVRLLVELLRQIMDPLSHVVLSLQLLRTFSHFPDNLVVMVNCQAAPAVLGCMAVYLDVTEIQQYGLDILAKIATYRPRPEEKIPLRETALEMILRSIQRHQKSVYIVPPGCRTLVNLTCTLQENLDTFLSTEVGSTAGVEEAIEKYDLLLRHIFHHAIPIIQAVLLEYPNNLDVRTEGRRFLYNYSKMTQITQKKKLRSLSKSAPDESPDTFTETLTVPTTFISNNQEEEPSGILKKTEQKGFMATLDRKVHFADDKGPLDYITSSDEESDPDLLTSGVEAKLEITQTVILSEEDAKALRDGSSFNQETKGISETESQRETNQTRQRTENEREERTEKRYTSEMKINFSQQGEIEEVVTKCGQTDITIATSPSGNNSVSVFCPTVNCNGHLRNSDPICQPEATLKLSCVPEVEKEPNCTSPDNRKETAKNDDQISEVGEPEQNQLNRPNETRLNRPNENQLNRLNKNMEGEGILEDYVVIDESSQQSQLESSNQGNTLTSTSQDSDEEDYMPMDWPQTNGIMSEEDGKKKGDDVCFRKKQQTSEAQELRYSVSDVSLCTKIIRLQVSQFISSLVFGGRDAQALSIIDKPLIKLLDVSEAPRGLLTYVKAQYEETKTLMDLDTSFLISVIDAIRYRSLFHELVQKSVLEVLNCLFGRYSLDVVGVAMFCLIAAFQNEYLLSLLSEFVRQISQ